MSSPPELLEPEDAVLDARRRKLILAAMCVALVAVVSSVSGLNVALQDLAISLEAGQSQLLWVINGYTVALAALLLPIGAIGDRWGRKRVLVAGLVLFLAANVASSMAGSVEVLIGLRIVAGAAAAMIMPVTLSVITSSFPPADRDRAVGVWAGFAGAGGIFGLFASSIVIDYFSWPWVFAAPIAMAAAALAMTLRAVPESREHNGGRFDVPGSIFSAVAIGALVLGIHEGPEAGWSEPITMVALAIGLASLGAFALWELRTEHPLLNIRVFRNRTLSAGSAALMAVFAIMGGLFLVLIQFLQAVLGFSAVVASAGLIPMALVMMPLSTIAPLITRRVGLRVMLAGGLGLVAVGVVVMATFTTADGGYLSVLPGLLIAGAGVGLTMTPGTAAITGSLPVEEQGVASALNDTVREVAAAIGVALIGSVLSAGYTSAVTGATEGLPAPQAEAVREGIGGAVAVTSQMGEAGESLLHSARVAFVDGWTVSMWISAGLAAAVALVSLFWVPSRRHELEARQEALDAMGIEDDGALEAIVIEPVG
jgi:EmrB/QacA subfamily drug resistance transporter